MLHITQRLINNFRNIDCCRLIDSMLRQVFSQSHFRPPVDGYGKNKAKRCRLSFSTRLRPTRPPATQANKMNDGKANKKCKGVKKAVVKNSITFENYKDCLFNGVTHRARFNTLRSRRHEITTECITKVALSANDDKRCVIPNDPEHRTLALRHHGINGLHRVAGPKRNTARTPTSGRGFWWVCKRPKEQRVSREIFR